MADPERFAIEVHWRSWGIGVSFYPGDFSVHIGPVSFFWRRSNG